MADEQQASLDRPLPILSWAMYDFANTIYSAVVVTAFFPKFMAQLAGRDLYTGLTQTVSMVLAGLIVPVAGALADRTGKAKRYLWWLTLACCAATLCIGVAANDANYDGKNGFTAHAQVMVPVLLFFGLANLTYQASLVFYNTLLPAVASPRRQGFVSGFGVGLGYLGVVVALPIALYARNATGTMRVTFLLAGVAFLVSSLPLFLFVRPRRPSHPASMAIAGHFAKLGSTLRAVCQTRPVLFFFLGNFLVVDVLNTLIMWTRPFLEQGAGFSEDASGYTLLAMSVTAFLLGMGMGWFTDKLGPKRMLLGSALSMLLCIIVVCAVPARVVILPVILLFGSGGLAGIWTAGRKWLLDIAPPDRVGEFFGLYGVTIKLSVLGCSVFALLADWTHSYRVALLGQLVFLVPGICFLAAAKPPQRLASTEERADDSEPCDAIRRDGPTAP
ncbi:MAG TPA: MFS transporter [Planctomycetota bacterium]|nr:MFS transporter [Planctomycetota bacterium]